MEAQESERMEGMNFDWIKIGIVTGVLFFCLFGKMAYAAQTAENRVTEQEFFDSLLKTMEEDAKRKVMEGEAFGKKYLTRERAAYILMKAEKAKGEEKSKGEEKEKKKLYDMVLDKNRISDFSKIKKVYRESAVEAYIEGIMIGTGNGPFSSNRSFRPKDYLTRKEKGEIIIRFKNPKKRRTISPDGQLIRTTKLPANYKDFSYILASFPNSYYESMFDYERIIGKAVEGEDFVKPKNIEKEKVTKIPGEVISMKWVIDTYGDQWVNTIRENLETRFNVDYRIIDQNKKWLDRLRRTYYFYDDKEYDRKETKKIKAYIEKVKKNKAVITGMVHIDKSSLYISTGKFYLRAFVKFKLKSCENIPKDLSDLFYADQVVMRNLKKGQWIEKYYDISVGSPNGYSLGADFAVTDNNLLDPLSK